MELKWSSGLPTTSKPQGSNRTFMELKFGEELQHQTVDKF